MISVCRKRGAVFLWADLMRGYNDPRGGGFFHRVFHFSTEFSTGKNVCLLLIKMFTFLRMCGIIGT